MKNVETFMFWSLLFPVKTRGYNVFKYLDFFQETHVTSPKHRGFGEELRSIGKFRYGKMTWKLIDELYYSCYYSPNIHE